MRGKIFPASEGERNGEGHELSQMRFRRGEESDVFFLLFGVGCGPFVLIVFARVQRGRLRRLFVLNRVFSGAK